MGFLRVFQDFHYFANRDMFVNEKFDREGSHLFNLQMQKLEKISIAEK